MAQLDVSREMRLELEAGLLRLLVQVLGLLQSAAASSTTPDASSLGETIITSIQVAILSVVHAWLPVGITICSLYTDHNILLHFIVSQICSAENNVKKACAILSKIMTVKEHPRSSIRDEVTFWVLGDILSMVPSFSKHFGDGGDRDVAFELVDCVVSIVAAELPLLCRPDNFQMSIFDLLLTFLSQKPRKLASMTFEVWCNLDDIPARERHPFLTSADSANFNYSIYTRILEVLVNQSIFLTTSEEDPEDILEFRDVRQVFACPIYLSYHVFT